MSVRGPHARPWQIRIWDRVSVPSDQSQCWTWQGHLDQGGYGRLTMDGGHRALKRRAHRCMYELLVGPIPDGLQLDHLCSNPSCVNPTHLEPVTNRENTIRSFERRRAVSQAN